MDSVRRKRPISLLNNVVNDDNKNILTYSEFRKILKRKKK